MPLIICNRNLRTEGSPRSAEMFTPLLCDCALMDFHSVLETGVNPIVHTTGKMKQNKNLGALELFTVCIRFSRNVSII